VVGLHPENQPFIHRKCTASPFLLRNSAALSAV
jgi:hypothetical protein